jgi:hypothetical protein
MIDTRKPRFLKGGAFHFYGKKQVGKQGIALQDFFGSGITSAARSIPG